MIGKIIVISLLTSFSASGSTALIKAQAELNRKIEMRERQLQANENKIKSLRMEPVAPPTVKPNAMSFNSPPLKCIKSNFPWVLSDYSKEFMDCTYKLNIGNPKEIKSLYAALQIMRESGWSVDKNEVYKQNRINEKQIMNEERYRFVRKKR